MKATDRCGCCSRPYDFPRSLYMVLDHDHTTGKPRDYICQSCNHVVGRFERGATLLKPEAMKLAAAYVRLHSGAEDYAI